MSVFGEGPSARSRLGITLRQVRKAAGLSGPDLVTLLKSSQSSISQSSISRFERGQSVPEPDQVRAWAAATGVTDDQLKDLLVLTAEAKYEQTTWARHIRRVGLAGVQREVAEMERRARVISVYQPVIVPGLLQTPEVVRAVFTARNPGRPDLEAAIAAAVDRATVLYDTAKTLQFVIGEQALRWLPVGPAAAAEQAQRLAMLGDLPNVTVGILPAAAAPGVWATHGFVLFDDLDGEGIGLGHLELLHDAVNVAVQDGVVEYRQAFADLLAASVTCDDARALLARIGEELREQE